MSNIRKRIEKVEETVKDFSKRDIIPIACGSREQRKREAKEIRSNGYRGAIIYFHDHIKIVDDSGSEIL
ncbi:hypothetical protein GTO36_01025 [bacterium]|nr:hypothetical protein [bacterium]